jgi:hypothetical protein
MVKIVVKVVVVGGVVVGQIFYRFEGPDPPSCAGADG